MLEYIKNEANKTLTENYAVTYGSTGSCCLDLFATIGALRKASDEEIALRFIRAFTENPDMAMKILFFGRDIRGGLGERRVFRVLMNWLASNEPETVRKNIEYVAEYGRFDDLLGLMDTGCEADMLKYLKKQFDEDCDAMQKGESISLLGKWLPSVNASNEDTVKKGKRIAKAFGMKDAEYRKALTALRGYIEIIENSLREKDYTFDYGKQPSRALFKYRKAFMRNDREKYQKFLSKVEDGEAKLNADNVTPYEIVEKYLDFNYFYNGCTKGSFMKRISKDEKKMLNATWNSLTDFGGDENAIAVVDTSASMYWQTNPCPAAVALSLGLYFAERNRGIFKNHFIEFSARPQLIEIKGETFADRLRYIASFNEVANTNIEEVFDLILEAAVINRVGQDELPARLVIISDMEFDYCVEDASMTNFENAKSKYERFGYKLPEVVFWNVASRNRQQPVKQNEQGVALVSGVTPRIFSMIAGGNLSPYAFIMEVLESERYAQIVA
ncbi:MAG TPA: DUF2828 family protein [Mogibacterium sp.]|nr:DUF2828 family protein [Mogibacterium sp.]